MFVKYVTNTTSVIAQVIADLALLASGSPISALSASCDKVNSQIIANTDAPGWTILDAAGPGSSKVLTAKDATNVDKFLGIVPSGTTGIYSTIYDAYNAGTHSGTNSVGATTPMPYSATSVNTYFMLVNQKRLIIHSSTSVLCGSIEFNREIEFLSNPIYPAHANIGYMGAPNQCFTFARLKSQNGAGDLVASSGGQNAGAIMTISSTNGSLPIASTLRDAGDAQYLPMLPCYIGYAYGSGSIPFGKVDDAYVTSSVGNNLDTVIVGADTYVMLNLTTIGHILFKLG